MFLSGKGRVISSGHFNTKNNKKMSVLTVQINGEIHKFFGSGKVPQFNFGDMIEFLLIAQKQEGQGYTFYLAKAEEISKKTEQ
ncbi:hypothetical protein [Niallia endozanthoxylica]|uniref:Uncharacterized protein n=1 Tax=Niallia endozanthoxylica TaxID=2036016 RepID=A0A5J5H4E1_9BACI|nr:hypothetical protein [Niallia endozanthoxylica]KAA9014572.1 hypothetical protein F4V44_23805 [Niallia endozanthoxylica]